MPSFLKGLNKKQRLIAIICACIALALIIIVPVSMSASRSADARRRQAAAVEAALLAAQDTTATPAHTTQRPTTTTEPVTEPPYVPVKFGDDVYPLKRGEKWGLVNANGDVAIDFQYHSHAGFFRGYWITSQESRFNAEPPCSLIDANNKVFGKDTWTQRYDSCEYFDELKVYAFGKEYYNEQGERVTFGMRDPKNYGCGLAPFSVGETYSKIYGFEDIDGNTVIEPQFSGVNSGRDISAGVPDMRYTNDRMGVRINDAAGVIDTQGNYIIPLSKKIKNVNIVNGFFILVEEESDRPGRYSGNEVDTKFYNFQGKLLFTLEGACSDFIRLNNSEFLTFNCGNERLAVNKAGKIMQREKGKWGDETFDDTWRLLTYTFSNASGQPFPPEERNVTAIRIDEQLKLVAAYYPNAGSPTVALYGFDRNKIFEIATAGGCQFWNNYYAIITNGSTELPYIQPMAGGTKQAFNDIQICNNRALIVQNKDGTFYGIFVNDKLAIPMAYNSIGYDKEEESFTLTKGAETTRLYIAQNGRIIDLATGPDFIQ